MAKQGNPPGPLDIGAGGYELARTSGEQLRGRGLSLAVAESCTGGLLAGQIVAVAGSSDYFLGGVVAYANQIKSGILGVTSSTLAQYGAVSWQTAVEMAWGVLRIMGADVALSTTGIAGPTGGAPTKPVGLVYVALAVGERAWWERHLWTGSRGENNAQTVLAALSLLNRYLSGEDTVLKAEREGEAAAVSLSELDITREAPITVELTVHQDGDHLPLAFCWRGQRYPIDNWGRSWQDADGGKHYLVMTGTLLPRRSQGTFELYRDAAQDKWYMLHAWPRPMLA